ncbi:hypothetical protein Barb7_00752 [Bacteroidales bacterium Barb7]|nr:hypothetical protein Barb7_00752 [Bacteroidales bacterium Barb7]
MYNTITATYTVTDIRKTFEDLEADIRTIARRTGKWDMSYVDNIFHDILSLAENQYLESVDIVLINDNTGIVVRASKFIVNSNGTTTASERAGQNNEWTNIPNTRLTVIISQTQKWKSLSEENKRKFQSDNFIINWVSSSIDNTFSHLTCSQAQLYASKGYELRKNNYK